MEERLLSILKELTQKQMLLSYLFVFITSYLESFAFVGLIMPGAGIAVTLGYLASRGILNIYPVMLAGALGAITADISSFGLASLIKDTHFFSIIKTRFSSHLEKGYSFFRRYGAISVFIGRFIGFTRPVIPFIAGLMEMKWPIFLISSMASGVLWALSYYGAGYFLGEALKKINSIYLKGALIFVLILVFIGYKFWKKKEKERENP